MRTFAPPLKNKATLKMSFGEVAEWSIAAVLKTVVLRGTWGSNPCLSAEIKESPVKSMFYGTFSIYPADNRKTSKPVFTEPEMPKS